MDYLKVYNKAISWINNNTVEEKGIIVSTDNPKAYPEVTGYYIPTLLRWGQDDKAISFAKWLVNIQKKDGSWRDCEDKDPYVFDSAQILKGLLAIRDKLDVDENIIKGCEWILSNMQDDGRLVTPSRNAWGTDDSFCSEMIHLYCLSPIIETGTVLNRQDFVEKANKIANYYIERYPDKILNFNMLSHFYAYVMEAMLDIGRKDLAREAMNKMKDRQHENGMIEGMNDVGWTCSTGCFQLAIVWYQLGEIEVANKTFEYACSLQNESGGWYGSYPTNLIQKIIRGRQHPYYFPKGEISWCVKYFLDAYYWKIKVEKQGDGE